MAKLNYVIVVVDSYAKGWPPSSELVSKVKVPLSVATRYDRVRRTMSPKGLKRRALEWVN